MQNDVTLILAGLCLGIACTGSLALLIGDAGRRAGLSLGLVYAAFAGLTAIPLSWALAPTFYLFYMPATLMMLLVLPPALAYYIAVRTMPEHQPRLRKRDLALPLVAALVCAGFWALPAEVKITLFVVGDIPQNTTAAALALITFALIVCWLITSPMYLIGSLRNLRHYRLCLRELYSNVDRRDLRWIDWVMVLLALIWGAGAIALAGDNIWGSTFVSVPVLYVLTAACLLILTVFAALPTPSETPASEPDDSPPDTKYARSALSPDHAAKLAGRIEKAMRDHSLYLDPNLSLQKLAKQVGALPNQVSQTLNQEIGTSFFDYVAQWRINAAKPMILSGEASVLAVALDVGFNSRSTFYKAFKRETGQTPKDFRASAAS